MMAAGNGYDAMRCDAAAAAAAAWTGPLLAWAATDRCSGSVLHLLWAAQEAGAVSQGGLGLRVRKHQVTDREKANRDAAQYEMLLLFSSMC